MDCRLHDPPYEILSGRLIPYYEKPERVDRIKDALSSSRSFELIEADHRLSANLMKYIMLVHEPDYVRYVETIYDEWVKEGGSKDSVFPETFFHRRLAINDSEKYENLSSIAKAGLYCFDLSCPITRETFRAAKASVLVALSAAQALLRDQPTNGIFALSRPPGHHAGPALCGGYCFFNNAAIAARFLQAQSSSPSTIAILDVDYHHGNGTQEVFYADPTVLYVSLHAEGDYPYFTGSVREKGTSAGEGYNVNFPLPRNVTGDDLYCETLHTATQRIVGFKPSYLIVSLGMDTYAQDPISEFNLTLEGYNRIGKIISSVQVPTLFVMEGGYHLETLGRNVVEVLEAFEESSLQT